MFTFACEFTQVLQLIMLRFCALLSFPCAHTFLPLPITIKILYLLRNFDDGCRSEFNLNISLTQHFMLPNSIHNMQSHAFCAPCSLCTATAHANNISIFCRTLWVSPPLLALLFSSLFLAAPS